MVACLLCSLQVVSVAASRHSLFVTADGVLYSMGPNNSAGGGGHASKPLLESGQLGRPGGTAPAAVLLPESASATAGLTAAAAAGEKGVSSGSAVVQVAGGRYHSVAITAEGSVITWGLNDWGQLGRQVSGSPQPGSDTSENAKLHRHSMLEEQPQAAGGNSSSAAGSATTASSSSSGGNSSSRCTHGWSCHSSTPSRVTTLGDVRAVAAAAGRYSTLVLDYLGQLWVWGYDGCSGGQLPVQGEAWRPRKVAGQLANKKVVAFDVGEYGMMYSKSRLLVHQCRSTARFVIDGVHMVLSKYRSVPAAVS
jgi:alpha-tubulin suppressor-like RCC1 family protein